MTGGAPPSRSGAAPGTAGRVGTSGSPRATVRTRVQPARARRYMPLVAPSTKQSQRSTMRQSRCAHPGPVLMMGVRGGEAKAHIYCTTPHRTAALRHSVFQATALAASSDPRDALTGQLIKRMRLKFGVSQGTAWGATSPASPACSCEDMLLWSRPCSAWNHVACISCVRWSSWPLRKLRPTSRARSS